MASKYIQILGARVPTFKVAEVAFRSIYGIGPFKARKLCAELGLNPHSKLQNYPNELSNITAYIEKNYMAKNNIERPIKEAIKRKVMMGCYQGLRHQQGLPVHGQKTKTNGKTQKKMSKARARWAGFTYIQRKSK